jgi:two-component system, cell cycle sensor histidine kinase and response regulator CckA
LNGFLDTISNIKGEKAILLISAYRDSTNFYYNFEPMVKDICTAANVPVYHLYYHGLGSGIVGGKLLNHYHMARNALKMAIEDDDKLWETKTIYNHETQNYYIDYGVARHYGLGIENAPIGTIFTNEPERTLKIQKSYFQLIITSIVLLLLLTSVLVINIRMKKKINIEFKNCQG